MKSLSVVDYSSPHGLMTGLNVTICKHKELLPLYVDILLPLYYLHAVTCSRKGVLTVLHVVTYRFKGLLAVLYAVS